MNLTLDAILQILVGLGGSAGIVAFAQLFTQRRKLRAETAKAGADASQVISNTAVMLLEPARKEIAEMQENLDRANAKIERLTAYVEQLVQIIRDAGVPVPPMPPAPPAPPRP